LGRRSGLSEAGGSRVAGDTGGRWQAAPTKASRAGTARRCGLVEQGQKVQRERTSAGRSVTAKPAPIWWIWAGMQRTKSALMVRVSTPKPSSSGGGEAISKVCGVGVAMLSE
jgi:hypothetical protein